MFGAGIVASPMSRLRIPSTSIGLGELMLLFSVFSAFIFIKQPFAFKQSYSRKEVVTFLNFSVTVFLLYCIGSLYGIITNKIEWGSTMHNFSAFFFYTFVILFLLNAVDFEARDYTFLLKTIATSSGILFILFSILFLLGSSSFLGIDLFFELRFSGFALNPNQLAFMCIPIPFLAIRFFLNENSKAGKAWFFCVLIASLFIGFLTLSDALIVSWIMAITYLFANYIFFDFNSLSQKAKILRLSIVIGVFILFALAISFVLQFASSIYGDTPSNSQGSDRFLYWVNALKVWTHSPLFGLGPGSYSGGVPYGGEEAHNTFLDWLVSVGIIGLAYFLFILANKIFKLQKEKKPLNVAVLVSLCVFSLFHLTTRHFLFWILLLCL